MARLPRRCAVRRLLLAGMAAACFFALHAGTWEAAHSERRVASRAKGPAPAGETRVALHSPAAASAPPAEAAAAEPDADAPDFLVRHPHLRAAPGAAAVERECPGMAALLPSRAAGPATVAELRGRSLGRAAAPAAAGEAPLVHATRFVVCPVEGLDEPGGAAAFADPDIFVAVGIPSVDTTFGAERRAFQRQSWLSDPGAVIPPAPPGPAPARAASAGPAPRMLVRFVLGRHPAHQFAVSQSAADERRANGDVLVLDLREGRPSTGKVSGGGGFWGLESEVGMSRKGFAWWCLATRYAAARYVVKADDDVLLRPRLYLAELARLPRRRLVWGRAMRWAAAKRDRHSVFHFAGGMGICLSADIADWIRAGGRGWPSGGAPVAPGEANRSFVNLGPYHGDKAAYKATNADHEDVMIGRLLFDRRAPHTVVKDCRLHDVRVGANLQPVSLASLAVHHLAHSAEAYRRLHRFFADARLPPLPPDVDARRFPDPQGEPAVPGGAALAEVPGRLAVARLRAGARHQRHAELWDHWPRACRVSAGPGLA